MKKNLFKAMIVAIAIVLFATSTTNACTGVKIKTKAGVAVHGRTLEFGIEVPTSLIVVPRNYQFIGSTSNGDGLKYKAKYSFTGLITYTDLVAADGMNEAGLSCGAFFFPSFAEYTPLTKENQSKALSPVDFTNWILAQFATLDEVRKAIENEEAVIVPTVLDGWGSEAPPFHYIVYDKSGKSIVIEPLGGKLVIYDNPIGIMSNSPTFDWHMINLRNYVNLQAENPKPVTIAGVTLTQLGQGTGMLGLPGDFTPPARFVKAAVYCSTAIPSETTFDAINQVFHILNNFDIPKGVSREISDGVIYPDYTQLTCARDPQNLKYYYKTYNDQTIKEIDLKAFDVNAKDILILSTESTQTVKNITKDLKPFKK